MSTKPTVGCELPLRSGDRAGFGEKLALSKTNRIVHMPLPVTSACCNPCPPCMVDNSGDFAAMTDDNVNH